MYISGRALPTWLKVLGGILIGGHIIFGVALYSARSAAQREARREFLGSRSGEYDSQTFITRGVKCGMTMTEVDEIMSGAYDISPLMQNADTGQLVKYYEFRYGPPWRDFFLGEQRFLFEERFRIGFDNERRARRLERTGSDPGRYLFWSYTFEADIDLCGDE